MLGSPSQAVSTDFINGSATATGTVATIPADRYFSVSIQLSGSQSGAGTATPHVTYNTSGGTAFSPASGSVVAQLSITGLLGVVQGGHSTIDFSGYSGDNGATLVFNTGGATASCVINGFLA